jgi:hypothetical protein
MGDKKVNFPFTAQVCELFDISVLACPDGFYLGTPDDLAAGLRNCTVTRLFDTRELLEVFCKENYHVFLAWSEKNNGVAPDASDWD